MKYKLCVAYDVPCYADLEIEADDDERAKFLAMAMVRKWDDTPVGDAAFVEEHHLADQHRIVDLSNAETGEHLIEGLELADFAPAG